MNWILLALVAAADAKASSREPLRELSIVYVSSRQAAVAPCHCDNAPLGGVDRQLAAITDTRAKNKNVLVVDGGDNYFESAEQAKGDDAMARAELIADAQAEIKADVMVPGPRDFLRGAQTTRELGMRARANWLLSNVAPPTGRAPMFMPFSVAKVGELKVLLLAFHGKNTFPQALKDEKFTVEDPVQAAKRLVAMYRSYVDVIVLIAATDGQTEEKLAQDIEGPSIVLSANEGRLQFGTRPVGSTHIVSAGKLGKYLVRLDLRFRETLPKFEAGMEVQKYFRELLLLRGTPGKSAAELTRLEAAYLAKGFGVQDTLAFQLLPMSSDIVGEPALRARAVAIDPQGYGK